MKKRELLDIRERLKERVDAVAQMNHEEMIQELKKVSGWNAISATSEELRAHLLKWAVQDHIPDCLCQ